MRKKPVGWRGEPDRHRKAALGIKTAEKRVKARSEPDVWKLPWFKDVQNRERRLYESLSKDWAIANVKHLSSETGYVLESLERNLSPQMRTMTTRMHRPLEEALQRARGSYESSFEHADVIKRATLLEQSREYIHEIINALKWTNEARAALRMKGACPWHYKCPDFGGAQ